MVPSRWCKAYRAEGPSGVGKGGAIARTTWFAGASSARSLGRSGTFALFGRASRTRAFLIGLIVLGVVLRLATSNSWGIVYDGAVMSVMGQSFALDGEFLVPYASVPTYYDHYAPLFPMYLSLFYRAFGFGIWATKLAELTLSVLLIGVVWATTADFFGRRKAWYAAAFVAQEPMFLITSLIGYSEVLVGTLYVLMAWGAVKGLRDPRYFALAGLFAGLGFLAKASIGWVIVVALGAGFLWLWRARGVWILRNRWFLAGVGAFAVLAGGWTIRNLVRFGWPNWEMSSCVSYVYAYGFAHPGLLGAALFAKIPVFAAFFLLYSGLFLSELRWPLRHVRGEETSLPWTMVGSTFGMGWIMSSFFWTVEQTSLWSWDNLRYVVIVSPLILWLLLRETEPRWSFTRAPSTDLKSFSKRFAVLMTVFVAVALCIVALPTPYPQVAIVRSLDGQLKPGMVIGVDRISPEAILLYISVPGVAVVPYHSGVAAVFILSATRLAYPGFVRVASLCSGDILGERFACALWARPGMAQAALLAMQGS